MRAFVSLLIAVLIVAFASEAFAAKIYHEVRPGDNCVGDYLANAEVDTIDFVFQDNVPYSSASWTVLMDSVSGGAHGTFTAKCYPFPGRIISADLSPATDTTATLNVQIDTLIQTSLPDSIYWKKAASADSTALLTWVDKSYYWSDDFVFTTANVLRVIASFSSGPGRYILCLNVMVQ